MRAAPDRLAVAPCSLIRISDNRSYSYPRIGTANLRRGRIRETLASQFTKIEAPSFRNRPIAVRRRVIPSVTAPICTAALSFGDYTDKAWRYVLKKLPTVFVFRESEIAFRRPSTPDIAQEKTSDPGNTFFVRTSAALLRGRSRLVLASHVP